MFSPMRGLSYREKQESRPESDQLVCRTCGYKRILTPIWIDQLRARDPGCTNTELLARVLHRLRCSNCHAKNVELVHKVQARPSPKTEQTGDLSPSCTQCGEEIPIRRLQAVPGTRVCVKCQEELENGGPTDEPVYCKRCRAKMVWRVRESVRPTKYFLGCSNYPRCRYVIAGSW